MKVLVVAFCTAVFVYALASVWTDILQPQVGNRTLAKSVAKPRSASQRQLKEGIRRSTEFVEIDVDRQESTPSDPPSIKRSISRSKPPMADVPLDDDADELARRLDDVNRREAEVLARQESLKLIYDDIHKELALSRQVHQRANDTLIAARERRMIIAQVGPESAGHRRNGDQRIASSRSDEPVPSKTSPDSDGVRGLALIVRQLARQGNESAAASFLSRMKEREAAKILAVISKEEPRLANRLVGTLQVARNPTERN